MDEKTLRVCAVEGHRVPFVDRDGRTWMGRYVGVDIATGEQRPELVPDTAYYRKMLAQDALKEAPDAPAAPTAEPAQATDDSASDAQEG